MIPSIPGLVSVIMQVRDRRDYTLRALDSLAGTDYPATEFVIVDNGSAEDTAEFLREWCAGTARPATVLHFPDDSGGSARRNAGVSRARGEYLFFVDNDVIADDPTVVSVLVAALNDDRGLGAVSPLLLFPGTEPLVQCAGGGSTAQGWIGLVGRGEVPAARHRVTREQTWAPTAAIMVRRSSFDRVGGFDEAFDPVSLCEDLDLCCAIRSAGERINFVGRTSMRHYEGTTFNHLGHDKLSVWRTHMKVITTRWSAMFEQGPIHSATELRWQPVLKDYLDVNNPIARAGGPEHQSDHDTSFFASDGKPSFTDVRVGVLGCGQAALRGALPAYGSATANAPDPAPFLNFGHVDGVRVVGVADPDPDGLVAAAQWYTVPHALRDATTLLDTVPMEGVVICTPPDAHVPLALAALARGMSVLVEKPAATNREGLARLLSAAHEHPDQTVVVNLPWQYHPTVSYARRLLTGDVLGEILSWAVVFEHSGPAAWAPRAAWYRTMFGGVITDLGPHALAVAKYLLSGQVAMTEHPVALEAECGLAVRATATVAVGGCPGTVELGWNAPGPRFEVTVRGTLGDLRFDLVPFHPSNPAVHLRSGTRERVIEFVPEHPSPHGPYAEFIAALRGERSTASTQLDDVADILECVIDWSAAHTESLDSVGDRR